MDFGIKAALMGARRTIEHVSRGTGRTTWAIDNAISIARDNRAGCLIITGHPREADRIKRVLDRAGRELHGLSGLRLECRVATGLEELERLILGSAPFPFVLDHFVIELLYEEAISQTSAAISSLRARAFPSGRAGYLPTDTFGLALYAFGEREERLGPVNRSERRRS